MIKLNGDDVKWLVRRLPDRVRSSVEGFNWPVFVAGGFVRAVIANEEISDVDLFTDTVEHAHVLATRIGPADAETPNAITIKSTAPVTQVIHRWTFATLEECLELFDFTIARAGITYINCSWQGLCDEYFYADLAAKRLRYMAPIRREDEAGSMLRLLKFYARGYRAPLYSIAGVIARSIKGIGGTFDVLPNEDAHVEFILKRLRVIDPAADPEQEGHLG